MLALSFPKFGHPAFAWVALAPLLLALHRTPVARAFWLGLTTGLVYLTGTLYWITRVMVVYGGLASPVAVLVNAALIAYLALFPAVFALVVARLSLSIGSRALLVAPLAWVATELGRAYLFTGFPWVLLGYSQVTVLPIAQVASLAGVYGVSALVASVSAALAYAGVESAQGRSGTGPAATPRGGPWREWIRVYRPLAIALVGVAIAGAWGAARVRSGDLVASGEPFRVGLIQGNVEQADKWNPRRGAQIFRDYLAMSRRAIAAGADLVVWPESSTPFYYEEDKPGADQIRAMARESRVPFLLGSDQIERGELTRYYNSAFLVRPNGSDGGVYRKMHLVPFGEYVPLKRILFFAAPLVEAVSDFSAGSSAVLLPVRGHLISTAICYEVVYPDLVRTAVAGGSELLTTITNDAWFGRTSAPYQHFAQASMRAIENGRYLVRSANTGISGVVDPYGRVAAQTPIFEQTVLVAEARFVRARTIYSRTGDVFAYASTALTLIALLAVRRRVK
ncbi:MAG: apolipoprotein N-acyltransferase [Vicinamibacterales bacterium]